LAIIIACNVALPMRKSRPLTAGALAELGADRLAALPLEPAEQDAALISRCVACPTTDRAGREEMMIDDAASRRLSMFAAPARRICRRVPSNRCVFGTVNAGRDGTRGQEPGTQAVRGSRAARDQLGVVNSALRSRKTGPTNTTTTQALILTRYRNRSRRL
jgi:hypothetical protein